MAFMNWGPDLELGIPKMDQQHRKLLDLINQLHDSMKQGKGRELGPRIIKELVDYTEYHFTDEEKFQQSISYPEYLSHKQVHASITAKIKGLQERANAGSTTVQSELLRFMRDWLVNHIQQTDRQYAVHYTRKPAAVR